MTRRSLIVKIGIAYVSGTGHSRHLRPGQKTTVYPSRADKTVRRSEPALCAK